MADIKRDFLYEFNRELRNVYSDSSAIVSVFESIDNGALKLSPTEVSCAKFIEAVGKCIFVIKKIVADPYKTFEGKQELVPVSKAQNMDRESVKLTLSDTSVWSVNSGKRIPKQAYTLINEHVYKNYENAFICSLIGLIIARLRKIKTKLTSDFPDKSSSEYVQLSSTIDTYVRKLVRLSNEKVFVDNNRREIDMSNIFVTDIMLSDYKYNYCYKFFIDYFKNNKANKGVSKDFRVLYHNFALVQILYRFYKQGYSFDNVNYYVSVSGKMFFDAIELNGEKEFVISQGLNGIDIACNGKLACVEFSKNFISDSSAAINELSSLRSRLASSKKYSNVYFAYLSPENDADGILGIGYKNAEKTINEFIKSL